MCSYVVEHLHDDQAVLVVDETGGVKKGMDTVGVQRQYTGTFDRRENARVAVYLVYAGRSGHAAVDSTLRPQGTLRPCREPIRQGLIHARCTPPGHGNSGPAEEAQNVPSGVLCGGQGRVPGRTEIPEPVWHGSETHPPMPGPAAPTTSPPSAATTCWPTCAPPASAPADLGFLGLDDDPDNPVAVTGLKATRVRKLTPGQKDANRALAAGRVPVERSFAHLKNWWILTKLRTDPARATHLLRALLVLTNIEATTDNWPLPQVAHDQHMPPEPRHRAGIG